MVARRLAAPRHPAHLFRERVGTDPARNGGGDQLQGPFTGLGGGLSEACPPGGCGVLREISRSPFGKVPGYVGLHRSGTESAGAVTFPGTTVPKTPSNLEAGAGEPVFCSPF